MSNIKIKLNEKHEISPYLYMQFMKPLGCADASVDAAWDFGENDWYPQVIEKVKELAPTMVRFGGCFASYYHWKEAIGPQEKRIPMRNHLWGGKYFNQVGTHEFLDFCKRVGAEPLLVTNMESEGMKAWQYPKNDTVRLGTDKEAAEWVDYCNNPDNALRIANGQAEPYNVKYWQIGNETSYRLMGNDCFNSDENEEACARFAAKMKKADPTIKIIGWGDYGKDGDDSWPRKISEIDEVDMIAFHHHISTADRESPIYGLNYRKDFAKTWNALMDAPKEIDEHIRRLRNDIGNKRLAMTEGHYAVPGRNRNELLSTWAMGVSYAVWHNILMRHSDVLDIATMADFLGNVWQCNAVMVPAPMRENSRCYLQPVGEVMRLFGAHQGKKALDISYDGSIDAVASASGNKVFVHVANTSMVKSEQLNFNLEGKEIVSATMYSICAEPETEIAPTNIGCFKETVSVSENGVFTLPKCAVAAIEIIIK